MFLTTHTRKEHEFQSMLPGRIDKLFVIYYI